MTKLSVNRKAYDVTADLDTPLLWVIRDDIRLTGTKFGCAWLSAVRVLFTSMAKQDDRA